MSTPFINGCTTLNINNNIITDPTDSSQKSMSLDGKERASGDDLLT